MKIELTKLDILIMKIALSKLCNEKNNMKSPIKHLLTRIENAEKHEKKVIEKIKKIKDKFDKILLSDKL